MKGVIALGSSEMSVVMKVVMTHCVSMQTVPAPSSQLSLCSEL